MTDRYSSLTVVLENDMREDDAEGLMNAIRQLKSVIGVRGNVRDLDLYTAECRVRRDIYDKVWKAIYPDDET